jgi:hypothetical protein
MALLTAACSAERKVPSMEHEMATLWAAPLAPHSGPETVAKKGDPSAAQKVARTAGTEAVPKVEQSERLTGESKDSRTAVV